MKLFANKTQKKTGMENNSLRHSPQEKLLEGLSKNLGSLNRDILEMNYIADGTNVAINAVGNSIDVINEGNSELATRTKEINQITIEMGNLIDQTSRYVEDLDKVTLNMQDSNEEVVNIFRELIEENANTENYIEEISVNTIETNQATKEIQQAIDMINSIAAKTNLLSLNASIEAARAGEAGRGFAVVAGEIRALAEQSRQSAEVIEKIIATLEEKSNKSVENIKTVQSAFEAQTSSLEKTNELMKQTNVLIQDVALKVRQIEVNEKELDDKKNVIIENMESLKTLSDSNYSATENIVSHFKKIVNNSFGIGEKAFDVSAVHEKMNAVCEQAVLKAQGNKFTKPEILKVAYMPNYGSLCAVVPAMKLGYFEKENLKIELYEYANGLEIIKAMEDRLGIHWKWST